MRALARGLLLVLPALVAWPHGSALAQTKPGLDCNLLGPDVPCQPYLLYPPGQDLRFTIRSRGPHAARREGRQLNTLREIFASLGACWRPPDIEDARPGMELTVRFSFRRDGTLLGEPRFTYISRAASERQRDLYRRAVLNSLRACTPLPFTSGLGGAVAGRPIVIRFLDDRKTLRAGIF